MLDIGDGANVTLASSQNVAGIQLTGSGALDIAGNSVTINYGVGNPSPASTIEGYLASGYANGAWNGTEIISSTAAANPGTSVGYAEGSVDTGTAAQPGQVLIKYTLAGDANLDGVVNFADFATVLKNFDQSGTDWAAGNFGYAVNSPSVASTNFFDFAQILKNFLQPLPAGGTGEVLGGTTIPLGESASAQTPAAQSAAVETPSAQPGAVEPPTASRVEPPSPASRAVPANPLTTVAVPTEPVLMDDPSAELLQLDGDPQTLLDQ